MSNYPALMNWLAQALGAERDGSVLHLSYEDDACSVTIRAEEWDRMRPSYESSSEKMWDDVANEVASFRLVITHLFEVLDSRDNREIEFYDSWFWPKARAS